LSATFVVKGTYKLQHGQPASNEGVDPEVLAGDVHVDEDDQKSLKYASDFAPFKPRADVFVLGTAHAPKSTPVPSLPARIAVGKMSKTIEVIGDRTWASRMLGQISWPTPFVSRPLSYEYAYGGPGDAKNPVGKGREGNQAHNLEKPKGQSIPEPARFGPLAATWPQRCQRLGTYDTNWLKTRWPWFPDDFDWGYFIAAPRDQQVDGYLQGDEEIVMEHLHPQQSPYRSRLPGLRA